MVVSNRSPRFLSRAICSSWVCRTIQRLAQCLPGGGILRRVQLSLRAAFLIDERVQIEIRERALDAQQHRELVLELPDHRVDLPLHLARLCARLALDRVCDLFSDLEGRLHRRVLAELPAKLTELERRQLVPPLETLTSPEPADHAGDAEGEQNGKDEANEHHSPKKNCLQAFMLPNFCRNVGSREFSLMSPSSKFSAAVIAEYVRPDLVASA